MVVADLEMLDEPRRAMMRTRLWLLSGSLVGPSFLGPELTALAESAPSVKFWIGLVSPERCRPVLLSYVAGAVDELDPEMTHDPATLVSRKTASDPREATEIWNLFAHLPTNTETSLATFRALRSEWQDGPNGPVLARIPPPTAAMLAEHAPDAAAREVPFLLAKAAVTALTKAAVSDDTVLSTQFQRLWSHARPRLERIHHRERLPSLRDDAGVVSRTVLFVAPAIAAELERRPWRRVRRSALRTTRAAR